MEMSRLRQVKERLARAQESAEHVEENINMEVDSETPGQSTNFEGIPGRAADATIAEDGQEESSPPDLADSRIGDGSLPGNNEVEQNKPSHYSDISPAENFDFSEDDENKRGLLGNGKSLVMGKIGNRTM